MGKAIKICTGGLFMISSWTLAPKTLSNEERKVSFINFMFWNTEDSLICAYEWKKKSEICWKSMTARHLFKKQDWGWLVKMPFWTSSKFEQNQVVVWGLIVEPNVPDTFWAQWEDEIGVKAHFLNSICAPGWRRSISVIKLCQCWSRGVRRGRERV